jgi:hypothetical protein
MVRCKLPDVDLNKKARKTLETNGLLQRHYDLAEGGRRFINCAIKINQRGNSFSRHDFPQFTQKSFGQKVFEARKAGFVQKNYLQKDAYYRVIGFQLDPFEEELTRKAMGVKPTSYTPFAEYENQEKLQLVLESHLKDSDELSIHNIRINTTVPNLYQTLLHDKDRFVYHKSNKSFVCKPEFNWEKNISVKLIVTSTDLVQIIFHNTFKPIIFGERGWVELSSKLAHIQLYLQSFSDNVLPIGDWVFKRADFGRDSKKPIYIPFYATYETLQGTVFKIYAKLWNDKTRKLRFEKVLEINKPIKNVMKDSDDIKSQFESK